MYKFTIYYNCGTVPHQVYFDTFPEVLRYALVTSRIYGYYLKCIRKHAS